MSSSFQLIPVPEEDWWERSRNWLGDRLSSAAESTRNRVNRLTNTSPMGLQRNSQDYLDLQKQWQADPGKTLTMMQDKNVPSYSAKDLGSEFNPTNPNSLGLGTIPAEPSDAGAGPDIGNILGIASQVAKLVEGEEEPVEQIEPPTVGQKSIASEILGQGTKYEEMMNALIAAVG